MSALVHDTVWQSRTEGLGSPKVMCHPYTTGAHRSDMRFPAGKAVVGAINPYSKAKAIPIPTPRNSGTGRRAGLKILRGLYLVRVRFLHSAPLRSVMNMILFPPRANSPNSRPTGLCVCLFRHSGIGPIMPPDPCMCLKCTCGKLAPTHSSQDRGGDLERESKDILNHFKQLQF